MMGIYVIQLINHTNVISDPALPTFLQYSKNKRKNTAVNNKKNYLLVFSQFHFERILNVK